MSPVVATVQFHIPPVAVHARIMTVSVIGMSHNTKHTENIKTTISMTNFDVSENERSDVTTSRAGFAVLYTS